jgi:hypothetical protein
VLAIDDLIAYFEVSLDASLGILHRPWFEQQLSAHLAGTLDDPGPTWHALRNVVFAAGCRIEMCKSQPFQKAAKHAWGYFENALSVYARLLFFKTSITGVQVLTLMVGSPKPPGPVTITLTAIRLTTRKISGRHAWNTCYLLTPSAWRMRKAYTEPCPLLKACRYKMYNSGAASFGLSTVSRSRLHLRLAVHQYVLWRILCPEVTMYLI